MKVKKKKDITLKSKELIVEFYDTFCVHKHEKLGPLLNEQNLVVHNILLDEIISEQSKTCIAG